MKSIALTSGPVTACDKRPSMRLGRHRAVRNVIVAQKKPHLPARLKTGAGGLAMALPRTPPFYIGRVHGALSQG